MEGNDIKFAAVTFYYVNIQHWNLSRPSELEAICSYLSPHMCNVYMMSAGREMSHFLNLWKSVRSDVSDAYYQLRTHLLSFPFFNINLLHYIFFTWNKLLQKQWRKATLEQVTNQ